MIDLTTEMALALMDGQPAPTEEGDRQDAYFRLLLRRFGQQYGKENARHLQFIAGVPPDLWAWQKLRAWRSTMEQNEKNLKNAI